jgi:hypothetical protein
MGCPPPHPDNCGAYDDDQHHGSQRNFPVIFYFVIIDNVRISAIGMRAPSLDAGNAAARGGTVVASNPSGPRMLDDSAARIA